ncbi:MAG: hypothetical protein JO129_01585 [Candidatus Dependentiae bacterium]|nr:hypothetical protein [Candidatus Dependentiae bacterium]
MKKFLYAIILLMYISMAQATWVIVKIDNRSDLTFEKAARNNDVEIASISQTLKNSEKPGSSVINLSADACFGSSGGCKIIAKTPQGNNITIAFYGEPTHRVANGRADYADLDSRNAAATIKKSMMPRVFMIQDDGTVKLIGFAGYDRMNQKFALKLTGSQGNYRAGLTPIK